MECRQSCVGGEDIPDDSEETTRDDERRRGQFEATPNPVSAFSHCHSHLSFHPASHLSHHPAFCEMVEKADKSQAYRQDSCKQILATLASLPSGGQSKEDAPLPLTLPYLRTHPRLHDDCQQLAAFCLDQQEGRATFFTTMTSPWASALAKWTPQCLSGISPTPASCSAPLPEMSNPGDVPELA